MSNVRSVVNMTCNALVNAGFSAGFGYLCARAFTSINPINAAVYGGIYPLVSAITKPIFDNIFNPQMPMTQVDLWAGRPM